MHGQWPPVRNYHGSFQNKKNWLILGNIPNLRRCWHQPLSLAIVIFFYSSHLINQDVASSVVQPSDKHFLEQTLHLSRLFTAELKSLILTILLRYIGLIVVNFIYMLAVNKHSTTWVFRMDSTTEMYLVIVIVIVIVLYLKWRDLANMSAK